MVNFENTLNKLRQMLSKYEEIEKKLADMTVINNQNLYRELSKEFSYLAPVIDGFKKFNSLLKQIEESEEIIGSEKDQDMLSMAKEELAKLTEESEALKVELKRLIVPPVENADKNTIIEIRAGTGGDEAALFCAELFRMYMRYSEKKNWKVEIISSSATGLGGFKEVVFLVTGKNVYDSLRFEYGGHRVQRIPSTEANGRIHTSAVTVAVLPEMEDADVEIKSDDLRIDVYRASGAGGQHVNKTESAVRITHIPTGLVVQCQDNRSQHQNKASAMKVLRSRLYDYYQSQKEKEMADLRKNQVGSGDRSQKVRTYNFPQNRVTDHRINMTLYKLDLFMEGDLDDMLEALKIDDAERRIIQSEFSRV
jgi:peptide chain release factor 1